MYLILPQIRTRYCRLLSCYTHLSLGGNLIFKVHSHVLQFSIVNCCQINTAIAILCILRHGISTQRVFISNACNHPSPCFILHLNDNNGLIFLLLSTLFQSFITQEEESRGLLVGTLHREKGTLYERNSQYALSVLEKVII